jgi:transcriptional regulator with XRE-family HTH domain
MFTQEELNESPDYWFDQYQNDIYRVLEGYMNDRGMNKTELANTLGYSKGYISQLLNGGFNHSLRKLIELSLKVDKIPVLTFKDLKDHSSSQQGGKVIKLDGRAMQSFNPNEFEKDELLRTGT